MSVAVPPATAEESAAVDYLKEKFPASSVDAEDTHFFDGDCYLRFVRAGNGDKAAAAKALETAIAWRKSYKPYAIKMAEECPKASHSTSVNLGGVTKAGFAIVVMTVAAPNEADKDERLRLLYGTFEELGRKGYEYFVTIGDFTGASKGKDPEGDKMREEMMATMEKYYPDRRRLTFMYNPPWFMATLFPIVAMRMDSKTKERIKSNQKTKDLLKHIDEDQLPKQVGGKFEMAPNVIDALARMSEKAKKKK